MCSPATPGGGGPHLWGRAAHLSQATWLQPGPQAVELAGALLCGPTEEWERLAVRSVSTLRHACPLYLVLRLHLSGRGAAGSFLLLSEAHFQFCLSLHPISSMEKSLVCAPPAGWWPACPLVTCGYVGSTGCSQLGPGLGSRVLSGSASQALLPSSSESAVLRVLSIVFTKESSCVSLLPSIVLTFVIYTWRKAAGAGWWARELA